jgi:hypothetical protein
MMEGRSPDRRNVELSHPWKGKTYFAAQCFGLLYSNKTGNKPESVNVKQVHTSTY